MGGKSSLRQTNLRQGLLLLLPQPDSHTSLLCRCAVQCMVHDSFLGPAEMAVLYASTLLNLHPPTCAAS